MGRVRWLNSRGPYPCDMAFCDNEKAFKRLWPTLTDEPYDSWCNDNGARTWVFREGKGGLVPTYVICCNAGPTLDWPEIAGMIAHEATHVCQYLWEQIGETDPGWEAEAYLVQSITREILRDMGIPDRQ